MAVFPESSIWGRALLLHLGTVDHAVKNGIFAPCFRVKGGYMKCDRHDLDTMPLQAIEIIESTEGSNPSLSAISSIKTNRYNC